MISEQLFKVTEIDIVYRNKVKAKDRLKIKSSKDAYQILLQAWDMNKMDFQEEFAILLMNRAGHCLGIAPICSGARAACLIDPKIVYTAAIKGGATSLILSHNHPSGNLEISKLDEDLTRKLCEAGRFLEIDILDHIIMTSDGYLSFADEGNASLSQRSINSYTN